MVNAFVFIGCITFVGGETWILLKIVFFHLYIGSRLSQFHTELIRFYIFIEITIFQVHFSQSLKDEEYLTDNFKKTSKTNYKNSTLVLITFQIKGCFSPDLHPNPEKTKLGQGRQAINNFSKRYDVQDHLVNAASNTHQGLRVLVCLQ